MLRWMADVVSVRRRASAPAARTAPLAASLALAAIAVSSACTSLGYYGHVARGQGDILMRRQPIERLLDTSATDPELARRLRWVLKARAFASERLGLPDNPSYRGYADLGRDYVVWNVYAAPAYSVNGVRHCFLGAGCVEYQGFFDKAKADRLALALQKKGLETYVDGVPAYSTLGWFDDPVLNTMMRWGDDELVGTIFHELAHQKIFVKSDAAFNESYANFVQARGLRQWHEYVGNTSASYDNSQRKAFLAMVLELRSRLATIYASGLDQAAMDARKDEAVSGFRERFRQWREDAGAGGWDEWAAGPINNAKLVPFGLYDDWTESFEALFRQAGDWPQFYDCVQVLARMSADERHLALRELKQGRSLPSCRAVGSG
ncbi:aminopeptidase [Lysobacter sp. CA199]|uniref:aminopeptidase n=1 Tax=Lysobacter sp. CA199 TaxID=3455608 RepID=UPI003F8CFF65